MNELGAFRACGIERGVFDGSSQSHESTIATMEALMSRVKPPLGYTSVKIMALPPVCGPSSSCYTTC